MDASNLTYEMLQERPHACDVCGKRFKKGNQLRQHLIIHKPPDKRPYSCYICERTFNRSHHLKLHVIAHTKQSPYRCEICGRGCNQMSNLRRHLQTHESERNHACEYCGSYRRHLRTHNEGSKEATCINLEGRSDSMYLLPDEEDVDGMEDEEEEEESTTMAPEISIREYDGENMILNTMEGETLMIGEPDGQGNVTVLGPACSMEDIQNLGSNGKEYYLIEVKDCTGNGEVDTKLFEQ
ncbi:zinc finger protein 99 [Caerostris darwini]|uniref:Zinc finger protein 99 n=1 Tax=Caerostris darwini TaxID=1538125 RepID=A0AAV4NLR3_9ARAC|nr:zinc finger protein 99 [Caerostris darwini]